MSHQQTAQSIFKQMLKGWITVREAAAILQVTEITVRSYINKKHLPAVRIGGQFRITTKDLKQFMEQGIKRR